MVSQRKEPWLLELSTMKYPENIPTLVLDLDQVFKEISHYFEIVIFSDDVFPVALDIANKWELPVTSVLHRDFCKRKRNHYVKDLSKLGRKMDKVLMIDHDAAAFQWQPKNGILIKPFTGDPSDTELADLLD